MISWNPIQHPVEEITRTPISDAGAFEMFLVFSHTFSSPPLYC